MRLQIRKIGNSAGVVLPSAVLRQLKVVVGSELDATINGLQLTLTRTRPTYTLEELLAQCDPNAPMPADMVQWEAMPPVGLEIW